MSCYDYEIEPNYPEVEEIIENATDEFSKFLHDTFVDEYKNIETAKQNNKAKEKALYERSNALNERERELEKRETDFAKKENGQYEKFKAHWFKTIGLAFDIGDTVYYLKDVAKYIACPMCNRARIVKAKVEDVEYEMTCPTCKGNGDIKEKKQIKAIEATVREINISICKNKEYTYVEGMNGYGDLHTYVAIRDKEGDSSQRIEGKKLYKTKQEAEQHITKE